MVTVSLYARVSSDKQAQENTIASQIAVLERQISMDGHELLREYKFIDNGYSGSNIIRPDLEKLRDSVAEGQIDKIYVHSPDRLSRKYAYQIVLLEEFERAGVEVIFLNNQINNSPESNLLLQMQGMIAEYERAKIMERNRRGRIYAANKGSINVMGDAPYGYRYINKHAGGGQAVYEIIDEEAEVVRKVFFLVAKEGLSSNEVVRRLTEMSVITRTGKKYWNRGTICHMLKNPAYKGQAAFGKTKKGERLYSTRTRKNSCEHPKDNSSTYSVEKENWIYIPVPSIVDEDLFNMVQEQLAENLKRQRARQTGSKHLLQGLIVCQRCNYAYYGRRNAGGKHVYYRCTGSDARYFGGKRICDNKPVSGNTLEIVVWEEVKNLLKNPNRILNEYQRRLSGLKKLQLDQTIDSIEKQESKLKRVISKFIDSYAKEYIDQEEFESRIKGMKQQLKAIEEQKKRTYDQKDLQNEMTLVVTNLEDFSSSIKSKLEDLEWITKRDIIRTLVKRIEVDLENINIVFRVEEVKGDPNLQHCRRRIEACSCKPAPRGPPSSTAQLQHFPCFYGAQSSQNLISCIYPLAFGLNFFSNHKSST